MCCYRLLLKTGFTLCFVLHTTLKKFPKSILKWKCDNCTHTVLTKNLVGLWIIGLIYFKSALMACWYRQVMARADTFRATYLFVLMHSGIVNGYLLCDAHTMLEPHRGTAAFFFFTHYRPFPLVLFMCLSQLTVLFLGASIVCVNNL